MQLGLFLLGSLVHVLENPVNLMDNGFDMSTKSLSLLFTCLNQGMGPMGALYICMIYWKFLLIQLIKTGIGYAYLEGANGTYICFEYLKLKFIGLVHIFCLQGN